jgi:hypothetical protein
MNVSGTPTWVNTTFPVTYYLAGVAQPGVKCDIENTTSSSAGVWTVSYSSMAFTNILTVQPTVQGSSNNPFTIQTNSFTTSSATGFTSGGAIITILGINIISLGGVAAPVGVLVCGTT